MSRYPFIYLLPSLPCHLSVFFPPQGDDDSKEWEKLLETFGPCHSQYNLFYESQRKSISCINALYETQTPIIIIQKTYTATIHHSTVTAKSQKNEQIKDKNHRRVMRRDVNLTYVMSFLPFCQ